MNARLRTAPLKFQDTESLDDSLAKFFLHQLSLTTSSLHISQVHFQLSPGQEVMAGVADKARLHLERSVPQLREWEERGIFTKVCFS